MGDLETNPDGRHPRVFVSYAHDSPQHKSQVLEFSRFLRTAGIDVQLDQWDDDRRRDWSAWAGEQVDRADFVLIVASRKYRERTSAAAPSEEGRGSAYEAALLRDKLTGDRAVWLPRLLPVLLPGGSVTDIPTFLQPYASTRYQVTSFTAEGAEELLRVLTAQPLHLKPALGPLPHLPPQEPSDTAAPEGRPGWILQDAADFPTHWLPRARGVEPDAEGRGWYFVGRQRALTELASWLATPAGPAGDHRMRVVTGAPGSGKSALLAHLIVLADRTLQDQVPGVYRHGLPPGLAGSIDVAVHARDKDTQAVVQEIAAAAGLTASSPLELLVALAGRRAPFVIVVDALDEAEADHIPRIARMLNRLAADPDGVGIRVVAAVRTALDGSPLAVAVRELGRRSVLMPMDQEPYLVPAEVASYVQRRLLLDGYAGDTPADAAGPAGGQRRRTPYQDQLGLAVRVARAVAERARGNFLVAQLVSRFLAEDPVPVDVSRPGWSAQFPDTVDAALTEYIARFGDLGRQRWARDLLTPLAFATGQGLPDNRLWAALASALSRPARSYQVADVHELMDTAATYLVDRSASRQRRTYRLYHSAMDQYLRDRCRVADAPAVVARTLTGCAPARGDGARDWAAADPYLLAHLAEHAARAGSGELQSLLADLPFLVYGEPAGLVRVLSRVPAPARSMARVYQIAAHRLTADPGERAAYLALTARQLGETQVAVALESVPERTPWSVPACRWEAGDDYQVLLVLATETSAVALAPDGPGHVLVVAGDSAGQVQLSSWAEGIAESDDAHDGHPAPVTAVAVTRMPDGRLAVLTGCRQGSLRLWHIDDGLLIPVGPLLADAHQDEVTAIAFGPGPTGHEAALTADRSGNLRLWHVTSLLVPSWSASNGHPVTALTLSRDAAGRLFAVTGGVEADIRLWWPGAPGAEAGGQTVADMKRSDKVAGTIASYGGEGTGAVFVGTGRGNLHRLQPDAGGRLAGEVFQAQNSGISVLQPWPEGSSRLGQVLAVGSANGDVTLLHSPSGGGIVAGELNLYQQVRAHETRVRAIMLTDEPQTGLTVTSVSADHQVVRWTVSDESQPLTGLWEARGATVAIASTCCGGPYPAVSIVQRERRVQRNAEIWKFDGIAFADLSQADTPEQEGWHPVEAVVTIDGMSTSQRPAGAQWFAREARGASLINTSAIAIGYAGDRYLVVQAGPIGELLCSEVSPGELEARSYRSGEPVKETGAQHWIETLAISSDVYPPLLVTGAADGALDLWSIGDRAFTRLREPEALCGPAPRAAFVADPGGSPLLLTGDSRGDLSLFTVAGDRLAPVGLRWRGHSQPVTAVAVAADAHGHLAVVSGDLSGLVVLWRVDPARTQARAVAQAQFGSQVVSLACPGPHSSIVWCKQGVAEIRWNA